MPEGLPKAAGVRVSGMQQRGLGGNHNIHVPRHTRERTAPWIPAVDVVYKQREGMREGDSPCSVAPLLDFLPEAMLMKAGRRGKDMPVWRAER